MSNFVTDWDKYRPYFTEEEMRCKHTGECKMDPVFMDKLLALRLEYGKAMPISSGYRHWSHPEETKKGHKNGEHTKGLCVDVRVTNPEAYNLLSLAFKHGFQRLGVQQKGTVRFLHIGIGGEGLPTPALWSY
jgi:uncharacterized protein YcbK (DUF882 family)